MRALARSVLAKTKTRWPYGFESVTADQPTPTCRRQHNPIRFSRPHSYCLSSSLQVYSVAKVELWWYPDENCDTMILMTKPSKKPTASKPAPASKTAAKPAVPKAAASEAEVSSAPATGSKIGKAELTDMIVAQAGLSKKDASAALSTMLEVVAGALRSGQTVGLPGLGTLSVKATAARQGVRPGTSEKIQIAAGKKVAFKVAADLKKSL
jgi:DNA-binding protein HU-beta